jgi:hypothetical protein
MTSTPHSVSEILDMLEEAGESNDKVSVGDVVEKFGARSYAPLLIVPALVGISPVGGIPGVPTFLAVIIFLFAVQMVFGRSHLWLPGIIENRAIKGEKVEKSAEKLRRPAKWIDALFNERLKPLAGKKAARVAAVIVVLLCIAVPPLELLPFAVMLPMAVIAAFGIALLVRDGLIMLLAFLGSGAVVYVVLTQVVLGSGGG